MLISFCNIYIYNSFIPNLIIYYQYILIYLLLLKLIMVENLYHNVININYLIFLNEM